jgi:very-short-patch-repair endonuclease
MKELGKYVRVVSDKPAPKGRKGIPRGPSVPQQRLWALVKARFPEAEEEKAGLVPGRRYTVDIVIERLRLAIEVDGWVHHGKFKSGFKRDREKDRALLLAGFRVLRFYAGEILKEPETVMKTLEDVVTMIERERSQDDESSGNNR